MGKTDTFNSFTVVDEPDALGNEFADMNEAALDAAFKSAASGKEVKDEVEEVVEANETIPATEQEADESSETPVDDTPVDGRQKTLEAKVAELERELAKKTKTVDRMGNELGSLRQVEDRLNTLLAEKSAVDKNGELDLGKLADNPALAIDQRFETRERDREIAVLKAERARRQTIQNHQEFFKTHVPDMETRWDAIAEVIREDGADPSQVRDRLYEMDPLMVFNLAKRAELAAKVKELNKQVESLKTKTPDLLKKVDAAARAGVRINGKSSGASKRSSQADDADEIDATELSEKDLDEALKRLTGKTYGRKY